MNTCFCVCFCNNSIPQYLHHWEEFFKIKNTFAVIDNCNNPVKISVPNILTYNEDSLRSTLNITYDVSKKHYWNSVGNRNIIWFYAYYRMLLFYIQHPTYDYYWFFDDDIKCNNWNSFFNNIKYDADFLSFFVFKNANITSQPLIPVIDNNTHSKIDWFNRFPGDKDTMPSDIKDIFGSFFAITRFSNKAMKTLLDLHFDNFYGYGEGYVPTMLNYKGLKLDTLYNSNNISRHFNITDVNITHKNHIINWEWI